MMTITRKKFEKAKDLTMKEIMRSPKVKSKEGMALELLYASHHFKILEKHLFKKQLKEKKNGRKQNSK